MTEVENMQKTVLMIVIVGVFLIVGIVILSTLQTATRQSTSTPVANETLTTVTGSGETVSYSTRIDSACVITVARNASGGETIPTSNYTTSGCTIRAVLNSMYNNTNWKVDYVASYMDNTAASNASGDITDSLASGTPWLTIIIVVAFAVIVLGLLSKGLKSASEEGQQGPIY